MKILISSHAFAPSIGGIETVSRLLATEFVERGQEVMVVTQTPSGDGEDFPYSVVRLPSLGRLFEMVRWCDIFWHNNLSLRTLWPAWILPRRVVITHQGSYCRPALGIDLVQRVKLAVVDRTVSVASSRAMISCFRNKPVVISNPYDARMFDNPSPTAERPRDLVFLGRLVAEKGVDLLLQALGRLRDPGLFPSLTIIGTGPEEVALQRMAAELDLASQVTFAGPKRGAELVALLRQHKILVIPSRYDEPFGVVALEGIASGCVPVGSSGGGLPEAIGACGVTFPNGDVEALARVLENLLGQPNEQARLRALAPQHLARFTAAAIAESYLNLFRSKLG